MIPGTIGMPLTASLLVYAAVVPSLKINISKVPVMKEY